MDFESINQKRSSCAKLVVFGILGIALGFILFVMAGNIPALGIVALIAGVITAGIGGARFSALSKEFKNIYLKGMIEKTFQEGKYYPNNGIEANRVYATNMIKKADRFHSEDLIKGSIEGVGFETCDLKLEERHVRHTKNGTQVYYVTFFLGRFFEFEFPKEFKSQVIVTEGSLFTFFSKLKKIELESVDFNKKFKTYTTNEHDAFYILTPHLMESILTLERTNPGTVSLSFVGKKLNIAINNNRNTFELSLFKKVDESTVRQLERDLLVIKEIVMELKLNRNIFTY